MINKKSIYGTLEVTTSSDYTLRKINIVNNVGLPYEIQKEINSNLSNMGSTGKIMYAESSGGLEECLKAADVCATNEFKNMGYVATALCILEAAVCFPALYADCFLNEKACLGVKKPFADN